MSGNNQLKKQKRNLSNLRAKQESIRAGNLATVIETDNDFFDDCDDLEDRVDFFESFTF